MLFYIRIVAEEVDAMVTGRMTPIILLVVRPLIGHGFAGRRDAQWALDGNSFMCGTNPHLSKEKELMSLDKSIIHGKEHRKPYRGSKAIAQSCRNHGGCPWCEGNRQYADQKRVEGAESRLREYEVTNG